MTGLWAPRRLAWMMLWSLIASFVTNHVLGVETLWLRVLIGAVVVMLSGQMVDRQSLRWRWLMLRHWSDLERKIVFDEDGRWHLRALPFETICLMKDDEDRPVWGHVHSRTLILGRERVRASTTWQRWEEDE